MAENIQVQNIVDFIRKTWPDIVIDDSRVAGWIDEINNGTGRGRTIEELRMDIFKYVVTPERVNEYVSEAFTSRGMTIETGEETEEERIARISEELMSGSRTFHEFGQTMDSLAPQQDAGGGVDVTDEGNPDESVDEEMVGGKSDDTVGILTSKSMKWHFDPNTGKWFVSYGLPSGRRVAFEASGTQLDKIFGEGFRPDAYETLEDTASFLAQDGMTYGGNISEMEGSGSFEAEIARVTALALDEGMLPDWAKQDPAVMDIIFIAQSEGKSTDWVIEEISKLPSFAERFPNISALTDTGLNIVDAVTGFLEMEKGIKAMITREGGDPISVTPEMVGGLIAQGHSLTDVEHVFRTFDHMSKNQGALDAFNDVLAARGMQPLTAEQQFEFMEGSAPAELYDIWEETSLHRAAEDAGLSIGVDAAIDLAKRTEGLTSYEGALEGLSAAARNLLQFRTEIGLEQYGLNEQDLIDLSLNLAPSSGTSQADIARGIERAVSAARAQKDRARVNPFKRFTDQGVPEAASLSGTRTEG